MTIQYKIKESTALLESFNWMSPEFKTASPTANTIKIKGIALRGDAVSRNKRHYVSEELKKAARSWIGKPLTVNHDPKRIAGHIEWMEYEDDLLEYLATVNKQPYVDLLRNKSADIKGVSVEANYLRNQCPRCGKHFYTEEEFHQHMHNVEFIKTDPTAEPHGIVGTGLSLVLAPEEPGVPGTTIQLMEAVDGDKRLLETVINEGEKTLTYKVKEKKEDPIVLAATPNDIKNIKALAEAKEASKVATSPITSPPKEEITTPASSPPITFAEAKLPLKLNMTEFQKPLRLKLGEPFADYSDFNDCVSKNQDKENPEAYCGSIKKQVEGETYFRTKAVDAINELNSCLETFHSNQQVFKTQMENRDKELITRISEGSNTLHSWVEEQFKTVNAKTEEAFTKLPKDDLAWKEHIDKHPVDDLGWKEHIEKHPTDDLSWKEKLEAMDKTNKDTIQEIKDNFGKLLDQADKNIIETRKTFEERVTKLQEELDKKDGKLKETEKKLAETVTRTDNLEDKQKGNFKGTSKTITKETPVTDKLPYQP